MKINKKRKYNLETNNDSNDSETNYGKKFKLQLNIQNIQLTLYIDFLIENYLYE